MDVTHLKLMLHNIRAHGDQSYSNSHKQFVHFCFFSPLEPMFCEYWTSCIHIDHLFMFLGFWYLVVFSYSYFL